MSRSAILAISGCVAGVYIMIYRDGVKLYWSGGITLFFHHLSNYIHIIVTFSFAGVFSNIYLISSLNYWSYIRVVVWTSIGFAIYFGYGIKNSKLNLPLLSGYTALGSSGTIRGGIVEYAGKPRGDDTAGSPRR